MRYEIQARTTSETHDIEDTIEDDLGVDREPALTLGQAAVKSDRRVS